MEEGRERETERSSSSLSLSLSVCVCGGGCLDIAGGVEGRVSSFHVSSVVGFFLVLLAGAFNLQALQSTLGLRQQTSNLVVSSFVLLNH